MGKRFSVKSNIIMHPYSLVEMLVVMAIIAILVGVGAGGYTVAKKWMAKSRTEALLAKLKIAIEAYKNDKGYYPLPNRTTPVEFSIDVNAKDFDNLDNARYAVGDTRPSGASVGDIKYEYVPSKNMNKFVDFGKVQQDQSIKVKEGDLKPHNRYYVKDGWNTPSVTKTISSKEYSWGAIMYICPGKINKTSFDLYSAGPDRKFASNPANDMEDDIYCQL